MVYRVTEVEYFGLAQHILELYVVVKLLFLRGSRLLDGPVLPINHINELFVVFVDGIKPQFTLGAYQRVLFGDGTERYSFEVLAVVRFADRELPAFFYITEMIDEHLVFIVQLSCEHLVLEEFAPNVLLVEIVNLLFGRFQRLCCDHDGLNLAHFLAMIIIKLLVECRVSW